jgi:hypothetical protein
MRIKKYLSVIVFFLVLILYSCKSYKSIQLVGTFYKGEIKILNENNTNFKFKARYDSLGTVFLKLYTNTGFKVGDFVIKFDSVLIKSIYDNSYKDYIYDVYSQIRTEIFLNELVINLLRDKLFENKFYVSKRINCDLDTKIGIKEINFYSKKCKKIFAIKEMKNLGIKRKFEIIIFDGTKIELTFKKV